MHHNTNVSQSDAHRVPTSSMTRRWSMILTRYLLRVYLGLVLLSFLGVTGVYWFVNVFARLSGILAFNPDLSVVAAYFLAKVPLILFNTAPLSLILASTLTVGLLHQRRDLLALACIGAGPWFVLVPVAVLSALAAGGVFVVGAWLMPVTYTQGQAVAAAIQGTRHGDAVVSPNVWLRLGDGSYLHAAFVLHRGTRLYRVEQFGTAAGRMTSMLTAGEVVYEHGAWKPQDVWDRHVEPSGIVRMHHHGERPLDLAVTPDILARWANLLPAELTFHALAYRMAGLRGVGLPDTRWALEWHRRVAFPVAGWVLSLVGLVVGVRLRPSRAAYPVILSGAAALGVAFVWWLGYAIVAAYAAVGTLPPWTVWLPGGVVVLGGLAAGIGWRR